MAYVPFTEDSDIRACVTLQYLEVTKVKSIALGGGRIKTFKDLSISFSQRTLSVDSEAGSNLLNKRMLINNAICLNTCIFVMC